MTYGSLEKLKSGHIDVEKEHMKALIELFPHP